MILWQTSLVAHYWELNCRNSQPESKNACLHFLIWAWNCKVQILWRTKQNLTFLTGNHSLAKKTSFWSVLEARETSNWLKKRCFHLGCQRIMKNTVSRIDIFSQTLTQLALLHGIWLTSKVSNLEHWRWSKLVYYGNEGARLWIILRLYQCRWLFIFILKTPKNWDIPVLPVMVSRGRSLWWWVLKLTKNSQKSDRVEFLWDKVSPNWTEDRYLISADV